MCRHVNLNISNTHTVTPTTTHHDANTHAHYAHMHTYDPSRANTRARTHTGTFTQHTMYVDIWIYASFHPVYRQYNLIQYNIETIQYNTIPAYSTYGYLHTYCSIYLPS